MRTFILLSAIPGSGKSTWARRYQNEHPDTYIVASDELRKEMTGRVNDFSKDKEMWEIFLSRINDYAKNNEDCTVIADATNLENRFRSYYYEKTPNFDRHVLVFFNIPFEICQLQNRMREDERVVPESAMERMKKQFEKPTEEIMNLYDEVIFVGKNFVSEKIKEKTK